MKKRHFLLLITISLLLFLFCACQNNASTSNGKNTVRITFQYADGTIHEIMEVEQGAPIPMPVDPIQKNHIFIGWYTHLVYGGKFDLSQGATQDITLYAKFQLDAAAITNDITKNVMKSIVKVECRSYNMFLGIFETSSTGWSQGSGFCYYTNDGYYYILTNCHVACKNPDYDRLEIKIFDYKGNEYKGYLYNNPNKNIDAISADYDLACLYFKTNQTEVTPLSLSARKPEEESDVIVLGAPQAQANAITFGKITDYRSISLDDTPQYKSNVTFPVLCHSAYTANGSSGGPVLNSELEVVGIHYAGNSTLKTGYAIPAEKIQEFLRKYAYN